MSVSLTLDAVRDRTKRATRRRVDTWVDLKPGDRLTLIEKGMGLPKGAKQVVVAEVEVTDVRVEPITLLTNDIRYGRQELALEGFPNSDPDEWVSWWLTSHGLPRVVDGLGMVVHPDCRRIEWRYLEPGKIDQPADDAEASDNGSPT
jgi:hypothetical protein